MHVTVLDGTTYSGVKRIEAGFFEAWVCAGCGFTEWYAIQANDQLAAIAAIPYSGVRLIDTSGQRGPFR